METLVAERTAELKAANDILRKEFDEREQAKDDYNQMREYTDLLIRTANVMIISLDDKGRVIHFNPAAEAITGYSLAEIKENDRFELLVPRHRYPEVHEEFERLMQGGMPQAFENPIVTKDGRERFISWTDSEIRRGGNIVGVTSFGIDITLRKKAKAALMQSEEKFRRLMEKSPYPIEIFDPDGCGSTEIRRKVVTLKTLNNAKKHRY
jgi:PAS domain S-box-containing protein